MGIARCALDEKLEFWRGMRDAPEKAQQLVYQLWLSALQGVPTVEFQGAVSLADAYLDETAGAVEPAIDALVSWQSTRPFGSGFVSGFGGVATMALTIPTALFAAWSTSAP